MNKNKNKKNKTKKKNKNNNNNKKNKKKKMKQEEEQEQEQQILQILSNVVCSIRSDERSVLPTERKGDGHRQLPPPPPPPPPPLERWGEGRKERPSNKQDIMTISLQVQTPVVRQNARQLWMEPNLPWMLDGVMAMQCSRWGWRVKRVVGVCVF